MNADTRESFSLSEKHHFAKWTYTQILATISVSLGAMMSGFSMAYSASAMTSITNEDDTSFPVTLREASMISSLMYPIAAVGGLVGGLFMDYIGRKKTILGAAITTILSWLLVGFAKNLVMLQVGRGISGFAVGVTLLSLPVYLSETIQPEIRGFLGLLPAAFIDIGVLLCIICGIYMNWSLLAFLGGALSVPLLVLMFSIPDSPRWFVSQGQTDRARKALTWLKGKKSGIQSEYQSILQSHSDAEIHANKNIFLEFLKRSNQKALMISLGLMLFQQLSGVNAFMLNTISYFQTAGLTLDYQLSAIILIVIKFFATIFAAILIDHSGRKALLYISNIAMIISLFFMGGFFYAESTGIDVSQIRWLPFSCFLIFIIGYSVGFGPIPWLMIGEILPAKIRGPAAGIATAFYWISEWLLSVSFFHMTDVMEMYGVFWLYGSFSVIGFFFVLFCVPETKGHTLEDIEYQITAREREKSIMRNNYPQLLKA